MRFEVKEERSEFLQRMKRWTDVPLMVLAFLWLALIIIQLLSGLKPILRFLEDVIWAIFILDVLTEFLIAPEKRVYLKKNWFIILTLVLPGLRTLRIFTILPRGIAQLFLIFSSLNQGVKALKQTMGRRGVVYVLLLTAIVIFLGAAGMYHFESHVQPSGIHSYAYSLWWTAMLMTTVGSGYFPHSTPGRLICFLLAVYALSIFGYVTASIATYFIDQDVENPEIGLATEKSIQALREEVQALRTDLQVILKKPN